MAFFMIKVEVKDNETGMMLVKESHIGYDETSSLDNVVEMLLDMLSTRYETKIGAGDKTQVIVLPGECTTAKIELVRLDMLKVINKKCRECYPSKALEHIKKEVGVYELVKDVVDEIDRYFVQD
jgi:hypothetical protein